MWRCVVVALVIACNSHGPKHSFPPDSPGGGDAVSSSPNMNDPACAAHVDCGSGRHCEVECTQYGPPGCVYNCHVTCVPDETCATVTTCAPGSVCSESCTNECQGMADLCELACAAPSTACEQITTEADCKARSDCSPVYQASGCTCQGIDYCTCTDEMASFVRCLTGT